MPHSRASGRARVSQAAARLRDALRGTFQARSYRTQAVVTSVVRDGTGRVIHALATIDGTANQKMLLDVGAPVAEGDVFLVANAGAPTLPSWQAERKLASTSANPNLDPTPTLPTPAGLALSTGHYEPIGGGGVRAWVFATWRTIGAEYGDMAYELQYRTNDPVDPTTLLVQDTNPSTTLAAAVTDTGPTLPRTQAPALYDFPRAGRLQIQTERVDYTGATYLGTDSGTGAGSPNLLTDATKSWDTGEWAGFALVDSAGAVLAITANGATALTVSGTPASGAYAIHPAFTGCTRGVDSTAPAAHTSGRGVYALSCGALLDGLLPNVDYSVRVRARRADGAISAWTAWATIQTDLDTTAPPVPADWSVTSQEGAIWCTWSAPVLADVPDLAGFRLYRADDDAGAGAELVATISPVLAHLYPMEPGDSGYFALASFDTSANESAKTAWLFGQAWQSGGLNLLTNADWERDLDDDDVPDDWALYTGTMATAVYGDYGMGGGQGIECTQVSGGMLPPFCGANWDPLSSGQFVLATAGQQVIASVYVKSVDVPPEQMHYGYFGDYASGVIAGVTMYFSDGVTPTTSELTGPSDGDTFGLQDLGDGWKRIYRIHTVASADLTGGKIYLGFAATVVWLTTNVGKRVRFDRPCLEIGGRVGEWNPGLIAGPASLPPGLLIDTAGIITRDGTFRLGKDGHVYSHVLPDATGVRNLGSSDLHWATVYADNLAGSAAHDPISLAADVDTIISLTAQSLSLDPQAANTVWAGPASGPAADPTFRQLAHAELSGIGAGDHHAPITLSAAADAIMSLTAQAIGLDTQPANAVLAGPATGGPAVPTFRALAAADLPAHNVVTAHAITAAGAWYMVGSTAVDTLGLIQASDAPGASARLLKTTTAGVFNVLGMGIGSVTPAARKLLIADDSALEWSDIRLSRGAANRLDFASGDSLTVPGGILAGASATPGAVVEAQGAAEQLRLSYDAGNRATFTVDSAGSLSLATVSATEGGSLTLAPAGDVLFNPAGGDVYPSTNYATNLGLATNKWLSLFAAELRVQSLIAQGVYSTLGGELLVAPTTRLMADIMAGATEMYLQHNQPDLDDNLHLEEDGAVESILVSGMAITNQSAVNDSFVVGGDQRAIFIASYTFHTSGCGASDGTWTVESVTYALGSTTIYVVEDVPAGGTNGKIVWISTIAGNYRYLVVTRNRDGSGANAWKRGTAVVNTGTTGDGFIHLYAEQGLYGTGYGPTIVGNVRYGPGYSEIVPGWAIGNLNGLYGYSANDTYGVCLGKYYDGNSFLTIDSTNGIRFMMRAAGGELGVDGAGTESTDTQLARWYSTGAILIGQETAGQSNVYITAGAVQLRTGTTVNIQLDTTGNVTLGQVATSYGNAYWDATAHQLKFRGGTNGTQVQAYIDTDGTLTAGGGNVMLNASGIRFKLYTGGTGYSPSSGLQFYDTDEPGTIGGLSISKSGGSYYGYVTLAPITVSEAIMQVSATGGTGKESRVQIIAYGPGSPIPSSCYVTVKIDASANRYVNITGDNLFVDNADVRVLGGLALSSISVDPPAGGILFCSEISDPTAPAANRAVLYIRDNGSGKTQLCVRFNTGVVQVLATQP